MFIKQVTFEYYDMSKICSICHSPFSSHIRFESCWKICHCTNLVTRFSLANCGVHHFHSITKYVYKRGAQRMMGAHGPMFTVLPFSLCHCDTVKTDGVTPRVHRFISQAPMFTLWFSINQRHMLCTSPTHRGWHALRALRMRYSTLTPRSTPQPHSADGD